MTYDIDMNIFYKKKNLLVSLLNRSTPGDLPPDVFEAVGRIAVYPAIEFIPLRKVDGRIEVLLFQRPVDDIVWPSMWHTPGTILRPTDVRYEDAFARLINDELAGTEINPPIFMGAELSSNARGRCLLLEHLVVIKGEPRAGRFFPVDGLPASFIGDQRASLDRAIDKFRQL